MSASLGGLIKDYRLQNNISQQEIAFALGWKDTARISRIEQGKINKPTKVLIDRICELLGLKDEERNQVLLAGNYLPSVEEINKIKNITHDLIHLWKYPASIRDFSWRIIDANKNIFDFHQIPLSQRNRILEKNINTLELVLSPEFILNKKLGSVKSEKERKKFIAFMLNDFRNKQRNRTKEKWYVQLIKNMMEKPNFKDAWQETYIEKEKNNNIVTNFSLKISPVIDNGRPISCYIFIIPLVVDPRFEIELYMPADIRSFKYFTP